MVTAGYPTHQKRSFFRAIPILRPILQYPSATPTVRPVGSPIKTVSLSPLLTRNYLGDHHHNRLCPMSRYRPPERSKLTVRIPKEAVMMLAYKLVRLIETHSDALATTLVAKVQTSDLTRSYRHVPPQDLKATVGEIYQHLGEWLLGKSSFDIERRYQEIGARRVHQGVPISELIWVIILTKETLWEFLKKESTPEQPVEAFGELEMLQLLDQFFDRAVHSASIGYEKAIGIKEITKTAAHQ
jgi:hypothetical protein